MRSIKLDKKAILKIGYCLVDRPLCFKVCNRPLDHSLGAEVLYCMSDRIFQTQLRAEMEALPTLSNIQSVRRPGALGMHEKEASEIVAIVLPFL